MKKILIIASAILLLVACSTDNKPVDPTMLMNARFTGITYTDETGNIVGPVDLDDWQLFPGDVYMQSTPKPANGSEEFDIIPGSFGVGPAYPNPFNGTTSILRLAAAATSQVTVRIVNQDGALVYTEERTIDAGAHEFTWSPGIAWQNPEDNHVRTYPDGIYRVYYTIDFADYPLFSGYGDIWLTHSSTEWWSGE